MQFADILNEDSPVLRDTMARPCLKSLKIKSQTVRTDLSCPTAKAIS